jgi:hypothetical protein
MCSSRWLPLLKWAVANGCPMSPRILSCAVVGLHPDVIEWALAPPASPPSHSPSLFSSTSSRVSGSGGGSAPSSSNGCGGLGCRWPMSMCQTLSLSGTLPGMNPSTLSQSVSVFVSLFCLVSLSLVSSSLYAAIPRLIVSISLTTGH